MKKYALKHAYFINVIFCIVKINIYICSIKITQ